MLTIMAFLVSFASGFLSLSQEILWMRLVGFLALTVPQCFAVVLALYLLGIALGALSGKDACEKTAETDLLALCGRLLLGAGIFDLVAPFVVCWLANTLYALPVAFALVIFSAALRGMVFPVVHHLGSSNKQKLGRSVSTIYFGNVLGATLGPLLTGFMLLDVLGLEGVWLLMVVLTLLVAALCLGVERQRWPALAVSVLALGLLWPVLSPRDTLLELLTRASSSDGMTPARVVLQNRHGIIHVHDFNGEEVVFGGNAFDGSLNMQMWGGHNKIFRAYLMPLLVPEAKRALVIGMSSGTWLRLLATQPTLTHIDVVEINADYLKLAAQFPQVSPVLHDPRIHIHIDDGRKWLNRHPDQRYDFVLMNTSQHWRSYMTNLLSRDFMTIAKAHLQPGGMIYFNATGSDDALLTANSVFAHAYRYDNFVMASDHDPAPRLQTQDNQAILARLIWPETGKPVLDFQQAATVADAKRLLHDYPLASAEEIQRNYPRTLQTVTDQNMITEYRYGKGFGP